MNLEKIARKIATASEYTFDNLHEYEKELMIYSARAAARETLEQLQLDMRKHWKACGDLKSYRSTATNSIITQILKELE